VHAFALGAEQDEQFGGFWPGAAEPVRVSNSAASPAVMTRASSASRSRARASGYPRGLPAAAAATAGDTATAPANPLPRSTGTISTFSPGCGAWSIRPLPR